MQKIVMFLGLLLIAAGAMAQQASLLVYQVSERGVQPYISRIIVTDDHVRLDEGGSADGYTLFDRQQEILYNVAPDEQTIFVINPDTPPVEDNPALILTEAVTVDEKAPEVVGRQPLNVRLMANGELCSQLVVIEGVMQEALDGLSELKLTLARVQAGMMPSMPLNVRTPCDLADTVHAADRTLRFGLPLQEHNDNRSQSLVDFSENFEAQDELFRLPAGFARRPLFAPAAF
jgi:hypothetical protein